MTDHDRPRLAPHMPFPPYAFVPGQAPHPESDPAGHSYGRERLPAALDPERWSESVPYLYGLDLFNAGYYWESHVEFESLWLAAGRRGRLADFFKALIALAAAGVKQREGRPAGVASHARRAGKLLRPLMEADSCMLGLRLAELLGLATRIEQHGWPEAAPLLWPESSAAQPDDL